MPSAASGLSTSYFRTRFLAPLVYVTLAAITVAGLGLYWSTSRSDAVSVERQIRTTRHALDMVIDEIALQQETVAVWDDTATNLVAPRLDQTWLSDNISLWLNHLFDQDEVFILDRADRPLHAMIDGSVVAPDRYRHAEADLKSLVDILRGRAKARNGVHDRLPGQPLAPGASVRTTPRSTHVSQLMLVGGRPAAASAMLVRSSTPGYVRFDGPVPILLSVRYLDRNFLAELAERHLIASPRFSRLPKLGPGEREVTLRDGKGRSMGHIVWRPELPGTRVLKVLAPATLIAIALIVLTMIMLARWLARATRDLEKTVRDLRASEAHAKDLAMHDVLTGLPNRALFDIRVEEALATRARGVEHTILALDLDRFKHVNDTLGHHAGDRLIREFAERLKDAVGSQAIIARLGGDEFALLVANAAGQVVQHLCERILREVRNPFDVGCGTAFVGVSIGVVHVAPDCVDRADLMRKADIALYRAKNDGRNCYRIFCNAMDESVRQRGATEDELRAALRNGAELVVHYQPQVDTVRADIVGIEALVRWQHPVRGLIGPDAFIPIAEETGLINELGDYVLREACAMSCRHPGLFVGVNLSPVQFRSPGFAERVIAIVADSGASPAAIELEVTEGLLLDDGRLARSALQKFRDLGMRIALDDFGTGYSSLNYLRSFSVDKIKIDRSFVGDVARSPASGAIVTAVIMLANALGLTVTAEGVETLEQQAFLAASGCTIMQGHLFADSLGEADFAVLERDFEEARRVAA